MARSVPSGVYRLQMRPQLGFEEAQQLVPYMEMLGISHLYVAPVFGARSGSEHGYDVVDPTRIDDDLGGWSGFRALHETLKTCGLGLILDIVPNHMAATSDNPWWYHVLAYGETSRYAHYFDIGWHHSAHRRLQGRILLPVLGDSFENCLTGGELRLDVEGGQLVVTYGSVHFPLHPHTYPPELVMDERARGQASQDPDYLATLLEAQSYQLSHWSMANDEINYRRFFDITELVGVRIEDRRVFLSTHAFINRLVAKGMVQGVRVDHVDGLYDPGEYLRRLRRLLGDDCYIVVEKILAAKESLPADWPVQGTTGYDFIRMVEGTMLGKGGKRLLEEYGREQSSPLDFSAVVYGCKREVIGESFRGQWMMLAYDLAQRLAHDKAAYDISWHQIGEALAALSASLGVYRTYLGQFPLTGDQLQVLDKAFSQARASEAHCWRGLRLLEQVLTKNVRPRHRVREWVGKWQQWTAAVMAKGYEDTALYRYCPLSWLCEVGGNPEMHPLSADEFHRHMLVRSPLTFNTTSTHDTKRSEDIRARLQVLSHWSDSFIVHCRSWSGINRRYRTHTGRYRIPDQKMEIFIYQTLLGVWPLRSEEVLDVEERLSRYFEKAAREAKEHTSWSAVNEAYERALRGFVGCILNDEAFLALFLPYQAKIAYHGALNSLVQTTLKMTVPGVPDIYQGNEFWDFSLVDPDNRRPVDFASRERTLRQLHDEVTRDRLDSTRRLCATWRDGRIKMYVIWSLLQLRRRLPELFARGAYLPLAITGEEQAPICAFARRLDQKTVVVAALLHTAARHPEAEECLWHTQTVGLGQRRVCTPAGGSHRWCELFSGRSMASDESVCAQELFAELPVAVLVPEPLYEP